MDFIEVIDEKISKLRVKKENAEQNLGNIEVYVQTLAEQLGAAEQQVLDLKLDVDGVKGEFISVLRQIPGSILDIDLRVRSECSAIEKDISKYEEMKRMYAEWAISQLEDDEPELQPDPIPAPAVPSADVLKEAVLSGEVPEPSKMTAIRRKPGTRPQMTLGQYRRILSGEDSSR